MFIMFDLSGALSNKVISYLAISLALNLISKFLVSPASKLFNSIYFVAANKFCLLYKSTLAQHFSIKCPDVLVIFIFKLPFTLLAFASSTAIVIFDVPPSVI